MQWAYLVFKTYGVFVEGELVLIPHLALAQSSVYQKLGEFQEVRYENESFVVIASEACGEMEDVQIKQGYPNWYMIEYVQPGNER